MNAIRRFLLRGGMASRMFFLAAFAVLIARALLPGAVMLDPDSSAQGGFAVVMCSGHGPMFAHDSGAMTSMDDGMTDTMPGMDMSHMPGMTHDASASASPAHNTTASDDGLCPFSAALAVACVGVALAVVLFALARVTRSWQSLAIRQPVRTSPFFRPLSRAPPLFG